jgi:hypothetical protein
VLNERGRGRFTAYSAGSHPRGTADPVALETLEWAAVKDPDECRRAFADTLRIIAQRVIEFVEN